MCAHQWEAEEGVARRGGKSEHKRVPMAWAVSPVTQSPAFCLESSACLTSRSDVPASVRTPFPAGTANNWPYFQSPS